MTIFNSKLTFTRRQPVFAVSIPALPNPELRWKTQSVVSPPARASAVHSKGEDPAGGRVTDGNGDLQRNCYPSFTAESESKVDIMSIGMIRPFTMQHRAVKVHRQQISAGCTQISLIGSVSTCFEPQGVWQNAKAMAWASDLAMTYEPSLKPWVNPDCWVDR